MYNRGERIARAVPRIKPTVCTRRKAAILDAARRVRRTPPGSESGACLQRGDSGTWESHLSPWEQSPDKGDRHNQHPGVWWPTRSASEPTPAQAGRGHKEERVNPRYRKGAKKHTDRERTKESRSNAQYRGAGERLCPEAWGTKAQGTHDTTQRSAGRQCRAWRWCQGKAGGTLSPLTVCTKLASSVQESGRMRMHSDGPAKAMSPCGLVNRKVNGPVRTITDEPYDRIGHVRVRGGGGGSNPAPYPALDAAMSISLHIGRHRRGASDVQRWAASFA